LPRNGKRAIGSFVCVHLLLSIPTFKTFRACTLFFHRLSCPKPGRQRPQLHMNRFLHFNRCAQHSFPLTSGSLYRAKHVLVISRYGSPQWTSASKLPRSCKRSISVSPAPVPITTWVDHFPANVRPYLYLTRIDKPIGTLLLFYPCGLCFFSFFFRLRLNEPTYSLVHHDGVVCPPAPIYYTAGLYWHIWCRCTRDAWRGLYDKRHVGQET
jgi:hypothetical protein